MESRRRPHRPHSRHGQAPVSSGMAGMILIGEPGCSDALLPAPGPGRCCSRMPSLVQRDTGHRADTPHWVNFAERIPTSAGDLTRSLACHTLGALRHRRPAPTLFKPGRPCGDVAPLQGRGRSRCNGAAASHHRRGRTAGLARAERLGQHHLQAQPAAARRRSGRGGGQMRRSSVDLARRACPVWRGRRGGATCAVRTAPRSC